MIAVQDGRTGEGQLSIFQRTNKEGKFYIFPTLGRERDRFLTLGANIFHRLLVFVGNPDANLKTAHFLNSKTGRGRFLERKLLFGFEGCDLPRVGARQ